DGVRVAGTTAAFNPIRHNSIFANGGLGIDLVGGIEDPNRVTANDSQDFDFGPNDLQNMPELTEVTTTSSGTTIRGTLHSLSRAQYALEFFASVSADPSGFGEGKIFLDSMDVTTDTSGVKDFTFSSTLPAEFSFVTATATATITGDTSEFSRAV